MENYDQLYDRLRNDPAAFQAKLAEDVQVGDLDVVPLMGKQVQIYMSWGYISAKAEADARRAKYEFQEDCPSVLQALAEDNLKITGRKTTVAAVQAEVYGFKEYKDAREKFVEAEQFANFCRHAVEAMKHRLHMIQSINSRQKSELNTLPR